MGRTEAGQWVAHVLFRADNGEKDEQDDDAVLSIEAIDKVVAVARSVAANQKMSQILKYVDHFFLVFVVKNLKLSFSLSLFFYNLTAFNTRNY